MNGKIAVSALILTLLVVVSCTAPETGIPTPVAVLKSPQPTAIPEGTDIGDGGLLSGLPCTAPCVYGIRIGETQLDQVIPVLEQNGLSGCQTEESVSWIDITCGYRVVVQVERPTNIVNATGFYPSNLISLGEIIEKYGEPDYVFLQAEGTTEAPTSRISLCWDSLRMVIEMPEINSHTYALEETSTAEMVVFLDEAQFIDSSQVQFGEYYKSWEGYNTYQP